LLQRGNSYDRNGTRQPSESPSTPSSLGFFLVRLGARHEGPEPAPERPDSRGAFCQLRPPLLPPAGSFLLGARARVARCRDQPLPVRRGGGSTPQRNLSALRARRVMTGEIFLAHVEQHLAPSLKRKDIVIMDDLSAHRVPGIRETIEAVVATLRYLPQSPGARRLSALGLSDLPEFNHHAFRVLAPRAFEGPEIESRLTRLNLRQIHLRGAFWAPRAIVRVRVYRRIFELRHGALPPSYRRGALQAINVMLAWRALPEL
jgi:hypothetical protein